MEWWQVMVCLVQFHGQDGLGDAPAIHPALESISHSPLQGIAALKLVEVSSSLCQWHLPAPNPVQCNKTDAHLSTSTEIVPLTAARPAYAVDELCRREALT